MAKYCFMMSVGGKTGFRCLGGKGGMAGCIDFGVAEPRKFLIAMYVDSWKNIQHFFRLGDGKTFPRNPRSEEMLVKLAKELVKVDSSR